MDINLYDSLNALSPNSFTQRAKPLLGARHTQESRRKISDANSRRVRKDESHLKTSNSLKKFYENEDARKILSLRSTGKKHTEEAKEKIRAARAKQIISDVTRLKISLAHKGKVISEEQRKKLSLANKGKKKGPRSEEHCKKIAESLKRSLMLKKLQSKN